MKPLHVAVVGCGPAGLAAALLLARDGHRPVLFERYSVKEHVREVEHRGKLLADIVDW